MRKLAATIVLVGMAFAAIAIAAEGWQNDQDARGHKLYGLAAPDRSTSAATVHFVTPGACIPKATAADGNLICSVGDVDYLTPAYTLGGDLSGTPASANVVKLLETSGPTHLTIGAVSDGQLLSRSGANLVGIPPPSAGSDVVASWTTGAATRRVYLVDGVNGNDANACFLDGGSSNFPISGGTIASTACKTLEGLQSKFPKYGAGRSVEVIIANGGSNTAATYTGGLASFMQGTTGWDYKSPLVRATGTNTTAGVTAFDGTTADLTYVGGVTATGCNTSGYNPIGSPSTTVVQLAKVGGGAAAIPAEPAAPLGWRFRWDSATATAALRNVGRTVVKVSTTTTTNDTFSVPPNTAWPATPTTSDTGYFEMAGVNIAGNGSGTGFTGPQTGEAGTLMGLTVVGVNFTSAISLGYVTIAYTFCGATGASGPFVSQVQVFPNYQHMTAGNLTVGGGMHSVGNWFHQRGYFSGHAMVVEGTATFNEMSFLNLKNGAVITGGLTIQGTTGMDSTTITSVGSSVSENHALMRITGSSSVGGLVFNNARAVLGNIDVTGVGAHPAVVLNNSQVLQTSSSAITGSTGNTDVGMAFGQSSDVWNHNGQGPSDTVTGTAGDVRVANGGSGQILTWAQTQSGVEDSAGNRIVAGGTALWPIRTDAVNGTVLSGSTVTATSLASGGNSYVKANSQGLMSPQTGVPGSDVSLTATDVGFGSGSNTLTGQSTFVFDSSAVGIGVGTGTVQSNRIADFERTVDGVASIGIANLSAGTSAISRITLTNGSSGGTTGPVLIVGSFGTNNTGNIYGAKAAVVQLSQADATSGPLWIVNNGISTGADVILGTGLASARVAVRNDGTVEIPNLGAGGYSKALTSPAGKLVVVSTIPSTDITGLAAIATSGSASDLTSGTLPAGRFPALTGDLTTTAGSVATTLASVGGGAGSCTYCSVTFDAKGRQTAYSSGTAPVTSVSGTSGRISSTAGTTPVLDLVTTAVTPGSYTYGGFTVDAYGRLTAASSGATPEVPLTFSNGATRTVNNVTVDLTTGKSGGQTVVGGTGAGQALTISSTTNATKGTVIFGTSSKMMFDETQVGLWIGGAAQVAPISLTPNALTAALHFAVGTADSGGYLISTSADQAIMSGGMTYNGTAWVAKSATASSVLDNGGTVIFYADSGLTPGSTFSPTTRATISSSGVNVPGLGSAMTKSVGGTLTPAVAATDYQAPIVWPTSTTDVRPFITSPVPSSTGATNPQKGNQVEYDNVNDYFTIEDDASIALHGTGSSGPATANMSILHIAAGSSSYSIAPEKTGTGHVWPLTVGAGGADLNLAGATVNVSTLTAGGYVGAVAGSGELVIATPSAEFNYYLEFSPLRVTTIAGANQYLATSSFDSIFGSNVVEYPVSGTTPTFGKVEVCVMGANTLTAGQLGFSIMKNGFGAGSSAVVTTATTGCVRSGLGSVGGSSTDTFGLLVSSNSSSPSASATLRLTVKIRLGAVAF